MSARRDFEFILCYGSTQVILSDVGVGTLLLRVSKQVFVAHHVSNLETVISTRLGSVPPYSLEISFLWPI
jgi:hypothetical protein